MCCFFPNHLNWWFAEARRATIGFLEKACTRLSASIFYCKESDTVSSIDWNYVVASFSLEKKIKQKFWMQGNKKDRQVVLLEKMDCVFQVSGWIPALRAAAPADSRS